MTAHNICFPQQRPMCCYKTEEQFVYFGTKINNRTANAAAAESSLTLAEIKKQSVITKSFFTLFLFLSVLADCFSQTTDVLQLHKQSNYKEENIFLTSPKFEIVQMVEYNSNAIDGNYQTQLFLQVHKVDSLIENRTFNITTGTDVLSCFFDMQSTWNWEPEKADVQGAVTVLKRTGKKITLLFDLTVTDLRRNRIYVYKGQRTFSKSKMARPKNWNDF